MKTRHVKPLNRRNGLTLLCSGVLITSLMLFLIWRLASAPLIPAYALLLTGLMMTFIGWPKLNEPAVSLSLCRDYLHYHHRYGGWAIKWNNIVRVDQPRVHVGWDLHPLPYIGFKIKRYDEFLPLITPRLAVHLLTEQRSVLLHAMQSEQPGCLSGSCGDPLLGGDLLEEGRFRSHEGQHYDGAIAMLAQRMSHLHLKEPTHARPSLLQKPENKPSRTACAQMAIDRLVAQYGSLHLRDRLNCKPVINETADCAG